VISSNTTSLPEVVGDAGIMVDPGDVDEICGAMMDLFGGKVERERLRKLALRMSKKSNWEKTAEMTLKLFSGV